MSNLLLIVSIITFISLGFIWIILVGERTKLIEHTNSVFICAFLALLSYICYQFSDNEKTAYSFLNVYNSTEIWLLAFLFLFTRAYLNLKKLSKPAVIIMFSLCSLDSLHNYVNNYTRVFFILDRVNLLNSDFLCWHITYKPFFWVHYALGFILIASIIGASIYRIVKSPTIYKRNYFSFLISFIIIVLFNFVFNYLEIPIDITIFLFAVMAETMFLYPSMDGERKLIYETLNNSIDNSKTAILAFDESNNILLINKTAEKIFGTDKKTSRKPIIYLIDFMERHGISNETEYFCNETMKLNGESHTFEVNYKKIFQDSIPIGTSLTLLDRTKEIQEYYIEKHKANHDPLTGIYNREYFFQRANERLLEEPAAKWVMVSCNIRDFKIINETQGTEVGDEVLRCAAEIIKRGAHPGTIYGRIINDRFGVLIKQEFFDKKVFIDGVAQLSKITDNNGFKLQINIGIYKVDYAMEKAILMFDKAEMAILKNRDKVHQLFFEYDSSIMQNILEEKNILADFDYSLRKNHFNMFLQPIFDQNKNVCGVEALSRLIDYNGIKKMPLSFIPVLEKMNYMYKLDRYIWDLAAQQLSKWSENEKSKDWFIAINISASTFEAMDVLTELVGLKNKYNINPSKLKLEVADTILELNKHNIYVILAKLQEEGFEICIDNFSKNHCSLKILNDLEANYLKLKVGFKEDSFENEKKPIILKKIVETAKILKMKVVVENVETPEQDKYLSKLNADMIQGFYYEKPMTINDFENKYL